MQQGVRAKVLDALCYASSDQGVLEECEAAYTQTPHTRVYIKTHVNI